MERETREYEFVVGGGGMAGLSAAISAARLGLRTALVQDRPVLGGDGSKETRLWLCGADGGANNRYFGETGLIEHLRLENLYRNPLGSAEMWDSVLLEASATQDNLCLYLNTAVIGVGLRKESPEIESVEAVTLGSVRRWTFRAPLFADCTGGGAVGFLAGADHRGDSEARGEWNELLAPEDGEAYATGGTIILALKDLGRPVAFIPPDWARNFSQADLGSRDLRFDGSVSGYWRVEWDEDFGTIEDAALRWEFTRVAYGLFDYLKNEPEHAAEMASAALEWAGAIPWGRESRRFLGDYVLKRQDLVDQVEHVDAVAVGGASIACPRAKGRASVQLPGMYGIPFRCLYSRNVPNLFFAGRNISATHVAHTSTRNMVTGAQMGCAIGTAAARCREEGCLPRDLVAGGGIYAVQQNLLLNDHYLSGIRNEDQRDLARSAQITESSAAEAALERANGEATLEGPRVLMVPLAGKLQRIELLIRAARDAVVKYALHAPNEKGNFIPGPVLCEGSVALEASGEPAWVPFPAPLDDAEPGFYWLAVHPAPEAWASTTTETLVGVLSFSAEPGRTPDPSSRWTKTPENLCFRTDAWIPAFYGGDQVANGYSRAHRAPNIWVSGETDFARPEWLEFQWASPREIGSVSLCFNTDLDKELRNIGREYDFRTIPECVRHYRLMAKCRDGWTILHEERDNYLRHRRHAFAPVRTAALRLEVLATNGDPRAHVYEVRIYGPRE